MMSRRHCFGPLGVVRSEWQLVKLLLYAKFQCGLCGSTSQVSRTGTISATRRSRPPKSINVALFKYPHRWENFYTKVFDVNNYALSFKLIKISVFQIFECRRLRIESNSAWFSTRISVPTRNIETPVSYLYTCINIVYTNPFGYKMLVMMLTQYLESRLFHFQLQMLYLCFNF
jgi:hypothetical protein